MKSGMRLQGQTGNDWSFRATKTLWEYTAGDITNKGNNWLSDSSPNADVMTRKNDSFDAALKRSGMVLCLAVPEIQMRAMPYKEGQYVETFRIFWYNSDSKGNEDYWRLVVFHHATIKKVTFRDSGKAKSDNNLSASHYEVLMKISADVEYFDQTGSPQ